MRLAIGGRDAGAAVDDPHVDALACTRRPRSATATRRGLCARRCRRRWRAPVRATPVGRTRGSDSGTSTSTSSRRAPRLATAAGNTSSTPTAAADVSDAGLQPAHVEQVADELVQAVGLLVDREQELVRLLGRPLDVLLEQARDRRLDRRTAACGGRGTPPTGLPCGARPRRQGSRRPTPPASARRRPARRRSPVRRRRGCGCPAVISGPRRDEQVAIVDCSCGASPGAAAAERRRSARAPSPPAVRW